MPSKDQNSSLFLCLYLMCQVSKASWTDVVSSNRMFMTSSSIEASRDQDEVRVELSCDGHHHAPEGCQVLCVTHGRLQTS